MVERSGLGRARTRCAALAACRAVGWVTGLVLVGCLHAPSGLSAQFGDPQITSISFDGNTAFSDNDLRQRILSRTTECRSFVLEPFCVFGADFAKEPSFLRRSVLPEDAARLALYYGRRGYRQVTVTPELAYSEDSLAVDITFRIAEDEPVRITKLGLVGFEDLDSSILEGLETRQQDRFDIVSVEADRDTLQNRLRNMGYAHAEVFRSSFIPISNPLEAEVNLEGFPGPVSQFGDITVTGTEELTDDVVRRMLPFSKGSLYRREDVLTGQRNLYGLEIVRSATVAVDLTNDPDSVVPVEVRVGEGDVRRVNLGGGLSTADCANAEARWTHRNLFGGARRLLVRASVSKVGTSQFPHLLCSDAGTGRYGETNWSIGGELTLPWVRGARNSASFSLFLERQSLNDVFISTSRGGAAGITHLFGRGAAMTVAWRPQYTALEASGLFFCVSFVVCDPEDIRDLENSNALAPLALTLSRSTTDQIFNPTSGSNILLDFEFARSFTRSAFEYDRAIGEASWYRALGRDVILATRFRGGFVSGRGFREQQGTAVAGVVHPEKRFYAGGSNSVRGYPQGQLGPRVLTVPVATLLGTTTEGICSPEEVIAGSCDPGELPEGDFLARPTGGSRVLVGNAEFRIWLTPTFQAATFVDLGRVWTPVSTASEGNLVLSPGLGLRFFSPIGPIRLDLAYRAAGGEELPVVVQQIRPFDSDSDDEADKIGFGRSGTVHEYVRTDELIVLGPTYLFEDSDPWSLSRLQFHISIGQAF